MTTLSSFQQIANNPARWQTLTAKAPAVANAVAYYKAKIGSVKTAEDLIGDRRLFAFAMQAFGLGDMVNAKGLMRKVLAGGVSDPTALASTLNNPKIRAFAKAFDFAGSGDAVTTTSSATDDVVSNYVEQTLETNQGAANAGVGLALYFQRNGGKIKNVYEILADKSLLTVVQTALGIPASTASQNIDVQAAHLTKALDIADLGDAKKLQRFIARFAAQYDVTHAQTASSASLNGYGLSADVLLSLQGLRRGG